MKGKKPLDSPGTTRRGVPHEITPLWTLSDVSWMVDAATRQAFARDTTYIASTTVCIASHRNTIEVNTAVKISASGKLKTLSSVQCSRRTWTIFSTQRGSNMTPCHTETPKPNTHRPRSSRWEPHNPCCRKRQKCEPWILIGCRCSARGRRGLLEARRPQHSSKGRDSQPAMTPTRNASDYHSSIFYNGS